MTAVTSLRGWTFTTAVCYIQCSSFHYANIQMRTDSCHNSHVCRCFSLETRADFSASSLLHYLHLFTENQPCSFNFPEWIIVCLAVASQHSVSRLNNIPEVLLITITITYCFDLNRDQPTAINRIHQGKNKNRYILNLPWRFWLNSHQMMTSLRLTERHFSDGHTFLHDSLKSYIQLCFTVFTLQI